MRCCYCFWQMMAAMQSVDEDQLSTSVVLSLVKRIEYTGFSAEPVTVVTFAGYQRSSAWCRAMHSSPAWYLCVSCTGLGFASVAL